MYQRWSREFWSLSDVGSFLVWLCLWFGMAGCSIFQADARSCFVSFPQGVKRVVGLARSGSRQGFGGNTLLGVFHIRCCWQLGSNSSCWIDKTADNPVYIREAFLPPNLILILHFFFFSFRFSLVFETKQCFLPSYVERCSIFC